MYTLPSVDERLLNLYFSKHALLEGPKLAVSCAAVKRVHAQKSYSPNNYEVSSRIAPTSCALEHMLFDMTPMCPSTILWILESVYIIADCKLCWRCGIVRVWTIGKTISR